MSRTTVLVTGASGVIGAALLPRLAAYRVIALAHRNPPAVTHVVGDIVRPWLGLDRGDYERLAAEVDVIVHCAAVTEFAADATAIHDINVGGAEEVIRFACHAEARLVHVSTAFVARTALTRAARGSALGDAVASPDRYLDAKRTAEDRVRESGLPAVIARPSLVIGDSSTGEIARFQGVHGIAGLILRNLLPLLPLQPHTRIDVIPQDTVADCLAALIDNGLTGEYWLTSGPSALTAQSVVDLILKAAADLGVCLDSPRLVPNEMVDRLIRPVFIDPMPHRLRRRFDDMLAITALFPGADPFPTSLGLLPGGPAALSISDVESAFGASMRYLAAAKGLAAITSGTQA